MIHRGRWERIADWLCVGLLGAGVVLLAIAVVLQVSGNSTVAGLAGVVAGVAVVKNVRV